MKKLEITLSREERQQLEQIIRKSTSSNFQVRHAKILLKADKNGEHKNDPEIAAQLDINPSTVWRTKKTFAEQGLQAALEYATAIRFKPRKLDARGEATLIALACSEPPAGRAAWTLRLLADKLVELEVVEAISHEAVRHTLKKTSLHRISKSNGASHQKRVLSS